MVPGVPGVEIERVVGRGASSTVYLATQTRFGRQVAVKVIDLPGRDAMAAKLFANECRILGRLTGHPDIVTVFEAGVTADDQPYLVMDYLPGGTLAERLRGSGPYPPAEVASVGVRLAGALETAHRHGVVHGDVKPQNVLWTPSGDPALVDFGIALLATGGAASSRLQVLTPLHAAPELLDGEPPTPRSDVYGLASTLFELVDGLPAAGDDTDSPLAVIARIARKERRDLDPDRVPAPLAEVIDAGLAHEPEDRPATMAEFGDALRRAETALGSTPTRMVVIDELPVASPLPAAAAASAASAGTVATEGTGGGGPGATGNGSGEGGVGAVDRPTLPPPARRAWVPWLGVALVAVVVAAVTTWLVTRDAGDAEVLDSAGTTTTARATGSESTTPTPTTDGSSIGGIQPDVTYDVAEGENTSPRLTVALEDTSAIFAPLSPTAQVIDSNRFNIGRTPAVVRYQAFNQARTPECMGFMSRPVTVTGLWERAVAPDQNSFAIATVLEFETREMADEAFIAFSTEQGPTSDECRGFAEPFGVEDYDELDVVHRDPALVAVPAGTRYNSWLRPTTDNPGYQYGLAAIAQKDRTLVLLGVLTTTAAGPADPGTAGQTMANLLARV